MKKVVAFLEQYAEWVGLGVASLFFLWVVYGYVVSPDQLQVKVGTDTVFPEGVDPRINENSVRHLQDAMEASPGELANALKVPNFVDEFLRNMGDKRDRMTPEVLAGGAPLRPAIPGVEFRAPGTEIVNTTVDIPKVPPMTLTGAISGNSMVAKPFPILAEGDDPQAQPEPPPQPEDAATVLANALDKTWITVEGKLDMKLLAAEWKKVFFQPGGKPLPLPPQVFLTHFVQLEVEREEQIGPDQWGNKVTLTPLQLVRMEPYPKPGDLVQQEKYRQWAETHQVDIVEPMFYTILRGDPWYIPSKGAPKDLTADATNDQPFDPATTTLPVEKMTPQQKQQFYIYNQQKKAEEQKAKAAERKSAAAAKSTTGTGSGNREGGGGGGGSGGRRIGGYAPLPIELASSGPGISDDPRRGQPGGGRGPARPVPPGRENPATPGQRTDGRRPPVGSDGYGRNIPGRESFNRGGDGYGRTGVPNSTTPTLNPDGQVQNPALTAPFDPTRMTFGVGVNANNDIIMWAHDDTVQSGKTYHYRMRVKLKNPLYNTFNLAKNADDATKFAIESPWTEWKEVTAPRTTDYYFTSVRQQMSTHTVTAVTVSVFRKEKGEVKKETFVVAPGDLIGGVKNGVDYSTGVTLVDLRPDVREKDCRILISDDVGNINTINYLQQLNDPGLKILEEKVNNANLGTGGTSPAAAGNPALINEVGGGR